MISYKSMLHGNQIYTLNSAFQGDYYINYILADVYDDYNPIKLTLICSVRSTIDRYKKTCADTSNVGSVSEANTQVHAD